MISKLAEKEQTIELRRRGLSYNEILKTVPIAKSTLSLWLRSVGLSQKQKQRLTQKKLEAARKGWLKRREQRLTLIKKIKEEAHLEIRQFAGDITKRDLWFMGTMLYWAEGSKEKEYRPGSVLIFSNSDPLMIKIYLKWLRLCLRIPKRQIITEILIHENHKDNTEAIKKYWADVAGFSLGKFDRIYFKKHKVNPHRKNTGSNYQGLLRIKVKESTNLNRKVAGWIEGICMQCGVV